MSAALSSLRTCCFVSWSFSTAVAVKFGGLPFAATMRSLRNQSTTGRNASLFNCTAVDTKSALGRVLSRHTLFEP